MQLGNCCCFQTVGRRSLEEAALSPRVLTPRQPLLSRDVGLAAAPMVPPGGRLVVLPGWHCRAPAILLCLHLPPAPFYWVRRQSWSPAPSSSPGLSAHSHKCLLLNSVLDSPKNLDFCKQNAERFLGRCLLCPTTSLIQAVNVGLTAA